MILYSQDKREIKKGVINMLEQLNKRKMRLIENGRSGMYEIAYLGSNSVILQAETVEELESKYEALCEELYSEKEYWNIDYTDYKEEVLTQEDFDKNRAEMIARNNKRFGL
ncbi:hypothetical protein FSBG_00113 [Fusobacterium gonidiaformans 3-1-5R]|uniref:Uncharacterized protein n=2 Tax=Fusobacterium TaxID=848 RepID=E5BET5_9FUSO|nr:hypothetical protein FSBG_00113 [Fusobacterium gonidiaformans 3-1-5R]